MLLKKIYKNKEAKVGNCPAYRPRADLDPALLGPCFGYLTGNLPENLSGKSTLNLSALCNASFFSRAVFCFFIFSFIFSALFCVYSQTAQAQDGDIPKSEYEYYYRAVTVLKSIDKNSQEEVELVPRGISKRDLTESLMHHPDMHYVLRTVASDLARLEAFFPKASLFEAYARLALGETRDGADLLIKFLGQGNYGESRHYLLLTDKLRDIEDWISLYIISLEWSERHPGCIFEQFQAEWDALKGLERYADAVNLAQKNKKCLDWKWRIYAAVAAYKGGETEKSYALMQELTAENPTKVEEIERLWDSIY